MKTVLRITLLACLVMVAYSKCNEGETECNGGCYPDDCTCCEDNCYLPSGSVCCTGQGACPPSETCCLHATEDAYWCCDVDSVCCPKLWTCCPKDKGCGEYDCNGFAGESRVPAWARPARRPST